MKKEIIIPCLLIILNFCLTSCLSLKETVAIREKVDITNETLHQLNGSYNILSADTSHIMLDYCLTSFTYYDFIKRPTINDKVTIEVVKDKNLLVKVYKDSSLLKSKTVKGQLKNGHYTFRVNKILPLVVLNIYKRQEIRIGRLKNGDLSIDAANTGLLFLLLAPVIGGGNENYNLIFKKKQDSLN